MNEDPDPWEERLQFGQLFLRYLSALGRPLLPSGLPPLDVPAYLEMIGLGEMLAGYDRPGERARAITGTRPTCTAPWTPGPHGSRSPRRPAMTRRRPGAGTANGPKTSTGYGATRRTGAWTMTSTRPRSSTPKTRTER